MYNRIRSLWPGWLAAGFLALSVSAAAVQPANHAPNPADQATASVNGKYSDLLRVIAVPGDQGFYGQFNDYGQYAGTS